MIEIIHNLPSNILGARASGKISASDYETVLAPAVEQAIKTQGDVRFLFHLGAEFDGYSPGAMWQDMKLGLAHMKSWKRLALVTDNEWIAGAMRMFSFAISCPVKVFANSEYADAVIWIASDTD